MQSSVRRHPICIEGNRQLSFRGIWIMPVAVSVAELTLAIVDKHFRLLVNSNLSCAGYCFTLSIERLGNTSVTSASNTPTSVIRNNMLILSHIISLYELMGSSKHNHLHPDNDVLRLEELLGRMRTTQDIADSPLQASMDTQTCGLRGYSQNQSVDFC